MQCYSVSEEIVSGVYNQTYFINHPEEAEKDGVLYCVVLVNKKTLERECIKIGIASGKNWKNVIKRSKGFNGYDIRIMKTYHDSLYNVWKLEQALHEEYKEFSYQPKNSFGGYTECFELRKEIISSIPTKK